MAEHESIIYDLQVRGAGAAGSAVDALNRRFATLGQNLRMTSQAAAQAAAGSRLPFFQKSGRTMVGGISHLPSFIKAIYKDAGANGIERSHRIGFASASDALAARNKLRGANKNRVGAQIAHYMMDRGSSQMWSAMSDPYQAERDARGKHLSEEHIRALRILNRARREESLRERQSESERRRISGVDETKRVDGNTQFQRSEYKGSTAVVPYVDRVAEEAERVRREKELAASQARWAAKRREILMEAQQRRKDILLSLGKWAAGPKMSRFLTAAGLGNNLAAVSGAVGLNLLKKLGFDLPSWIFDNGMKTYVGATRAGVSAVDATSLGWASRVYGGSASSASALLGNIVSDTQGALVGRGLGRLGDAALRYGLDITGSGMGGLATYKELLPRIANLLAEMNDQQKRGLADTLQLQEAEFMILKDGWANAQERIEKAEKDNPYLDPDFIKSMTEFEQAKTDLATQAEKTGAKFSTQYSGIGTGFMNLATWTLDKLGVAVDALPAAGDWWGRNFWADDSVMSQRKRFYDQRPKLPMPPRRDFVQPLDPYDYIRFPETNQNNYSNSSSTFQPTFNNTFNVSGNLDSSVIPEIGDSFKGVVMPNLGSRFLRDIPQTNLASPVR